MKVVEIYRGYDILTVNLKGRDWYYSSLRGEKNSNIQSVKNYIDTHIANPTYGVYNLKEGFGRKSGSITYPKICNGIIMSYRQFTYLDLSGSRLYESHHQLAVL